MKILHRATFAGALLAVASLVIPVAVAQTPADAQTPTVLGPPYFDSNVQFLSGQNVAPSFDGWMQNDDGTFTLVFGYYNRNQREQLVIPPGPNNNLSIGEIDQGQPTIFAPGRKSWVFMLKVPKDFGDKEVVWTLTAHGQTEKATGKLLRQLYITKRLMISHGNLSPGTDDPNKPPVISIPEAISAKVSKPLPLTAMVTDDGLPKQFSEKPDEAGGQVNGKIRRVRLTVSWFPYRGPEGVTFDDKGPTDVVGGRVTTAAHFSAPGTYTLIAVADDTALTTSKTITVNVAE